jgi:membrane-associated phospholipid phosphatase
MKEETFQKMTKSIRQKTFLVILLNVLDKLITAITFLCYPILLAYLFLNRSSLLPEAVLVPGVSFMIVTVFRRLYDSKRPYELYDFEPIIHKSTLGKSFPSRHVFSIFIIGMTFMQVQVDLGIWFMLLGVLLAVIRVFGGVHFIKDVTVGAAAGIILGAIGYYVVF